MRSRWSNPPIPVRPAAQQTDELGAREYDAVVVIHNEGGVVGDGFKDLPDQCEVAEIDRIEDGTGDHRLESSEFVWFEWGPGGGGCPRRAPDRVTMTLASEVARHLKSPWGGCRSKKSKRSLGLTARGAPRRAPRA